MRRSSTHSFLFIGCQQLYVFCDLSVKLTIRFQSRSGHPTLKPRLLTPTVAVQLWDSAFRMQDVPVGSQPAGTLSWTSQGNEVSAPTLIPRQHESCGYVARIWGGKNAYRILVENPEVEGQLWRWQDDIIIFINCSWVVTRWQWISNKHDRNLWTGFILFWIGTSAGPLHALSSFFFFIYCDCRNRMPLSTTCRNGSMFVSYSWQWINVTSYFNGSGSNTGRP